VIIPAVQYIARGLLKKAQNGIMPIDPYGSFQFSRPDRGILRCHGPVQFGYPPTAGGASSRPRRLVSPYPSSVESLFLPGLPSPPELPVGKYDPSKPFAENYKEKVTNFTDYLQRLDEWNKDWSYHFPELMGYYPADLATILSSLPFINPQTFERIRYGQISPHLAATVTVGQYLEAVYGKELANKIIENYINYRATHPNDYETSDPNRLRAEIWERPIELFLTARNAEAAGKAAETTAPPPSITFYTGTLDRGAVVPHEFAHIAQYIFGKTPTSAGERQGLINHPVLDEEAYNSLSKRLKNPLEFEAYLAELKYLWQRFTNKPITTEEDVDEMFNTMGLALSKLIEESTKPGYKGLNPLKFVPPEVFELIKVYFYLPEWNKRKIRRRVFDVFARNEPRHPLEAGVQSQPIPA